MELVENTAVETPRERFSGAVQAHGRAMFRAARAILGSDADAEDAVGEAVLRAWQSYPRLREPGAVKAWLMKITVNCAYEQLRKYSRVVYTDQLEALEEPPPPELETGLWDAVRALPEDHRVAVVLFYYEDMTVAEIAKILSVAQGTIKSRLSRARDKLKTLLHEEGEL